MGVPQKVSAGLDTFRQLVFDPLIDGLLTSYIPWLLAIPVVGPLIKAGLLLFANKIYAALQGVIVLESSLFTSAVHRQAFNAASLQLKAIAQSNGIASPEFQKAHDLQKAALKKFVQYSFTKGAA